ncbi:MAG: hypothetical protein KA338_21090 [Chloroflexi bacterium]|nr:hypothetical protein [Chloroflexota bacterium]
MLLTRNNFTRLLFVVLLLATLALMPLLGVSLTNQANFEFPTSLRISHVEPTHTGPVHAIACVPDPGGSQGCGGGCC